MENSIQLTPIGVVRRRRNRIWVTVEKVYEEGLTGLDEFSHVTVIYWFHHNDTPSGRKILQVHPRKCRNNPLTGVFATHSPRRPNLIAITVCKITSIEDNRVYIEEIDARDGSPVLDLKAYIPRSTAERDIRMPDWVSK